MDAPPLVPPLVPPDAETTRKLYLNHEASIQGIGSLYVLGSVLMLGGAAANALGERALADRIGIVAISIVFALAMAWVGLKLRKLDVRAKIPATILAAFGLLAFPIGTAINIYVLYLLHSAKGKYVFSDDYRLVREATPQIRYKMSIVIWLLVGLIIFIVILGGLATVMKK